MGPTDHTEITIVGGRGVRDLADDPCQRWLHDRRFCLTRAGSLQCGAQFRYSAVWDYSWGEFQCSDASTGIAAILCRL